MTGTKKNQISGKNGIVRIRAQVNSFLHVTTTLGQRVDDWLHCLAHIVCRKELY